MILFSTLASLSIGNRPHSLNRSTLDLLSSTASQSLYIKLTPKLFILNPSFRLTLSSAFAHPCSIASLSLFQITSPSRYFSSTIHQTRSRSKPLPFIPSFPNLPSPSQATHQKRYISCFLSWNHGLSSFSTSLTF